MFLILIYHLTLKYSCRYACTTAVYPISFYLLCWCRHTPQNVSTSHSDCCFSEPRTEWFCCCNEASERRCVDGSLPHTVMRLLPAYLHVYAGSSLAILLTGMQVLIVTITSLVTSTVGWLK
jgi:hypothetical protein